MPRNPDLITKRNEYVRERFRHHRKRNPKWNIIYIIEEVARDVYLTPATVTKILKQNDEKVPCVETVVTQLSISFSEFSAVG